ncbi:MAG: hypothetical protein HYY00_00135 [Chloroflexi bacterium]|nr:hypothetical protein [Chloroflexota bacterium]
MSGLLARLWYRLMRHLPLPSENKWKGVGELLTFASQATLEADTFEGALHSGILDRALDQAGTRWMWRRSEWLAGSIAPAAAIADLMVYAFKTLDMPTTLRTNGSSFEAVTHRCPFVERAKTDGMTRDICEAVCSHDRSLFHGFVQGFPVPVQYQATCKMGWGDPQCVKAFRVLATPVQAHPGQRHAQ